MPKVNLRSFWRRHNIPNSGRIHQLVLTLGGDDFLEEERDRVLAYVYSPQVTASGVTALRMGAAKWINHCRSVRAQNSRSKRHLRNKRQFTVSKYRRVWRDHPYAPDSALNKELNGRFSNEAF